MNSLQAGLIGVSVLVIALFAAWMWWQSWRSSREQQRLVKERQASLQRATPTASAADGRTDPTLSVDAQPRSQLGNWSPPVEAASTLDTHESVSRLNNDFANVNTESRAQTDGANAADAADDVEALRDTPRSEVEAMFNRVDPEVQISTHGDPVRVAETVSHAPKTQAVPTTLPLDDRLNVYAKISPRDGQAIDCQEFADLSDRTLAWGRVFRLSAWEAVDDPTSGGAVQELCLGLPIASRAGPLGEVDVLTWKRTVSATTDRLGLDVQFGGDLGVGERAAELDQFLAAADVICVLYLVRKDGGAWSGTRLRGTLEANGFRLQADGRFVYFEVESESPIFSAVDGFERSFTPERLRTENVNALRVVFEASNVVNPVARFDVYRQTLRALARLLESDIKDSNGVNVTDTEFAAMRADVVAGSQALADAGIECGSRSALALFR